MSQMSVMLYDVSNGDSIHVSLILWSVIGALSVRGLCALRWSVLVKRVIYAITPLADEKFSCALYQNHIFHLNLSFYLWKYWYIFSTLSSRFFSFFFHIPLSFFILYIAFKTFSNLFLRWQPRLIYFATYSMSRTLFPPSCSYFFR